MNDDGQQYHRSHGGKHVDAATAEDGLHGTGMAHVADCGCHGAEHLLLLSAAWGSDVAARAHHTDHGDKGQGIERKHRCRAQRGEQEAAEDGAEGAGDVEAHAIESDRRGQLLAAHHFRD